MTPATSIDDYLARPLGRYLVGPHYLSWCTEYRLAGSSLWGVPDATDLTALMRLWDLFRHLGAPRFSVITDGRRFTKLSPELLDTVLAYVRSRAAEFGEHLTRQAFIVPPNAAGAAILGTYAMADIKHEWRVFPASDAAAAFAWADPHHDRDPDQSNATFAEITALIDSATDVDPLLGALSRYLDAERNSPSLAGFAKAMSMSTRSLQRELKERGTSFRAACIRCKTAR